MDQMDSLSKKILLFLLEQNKPSTAKDIGKSIDVSSRTILRKMNKVEEYLKSKDYTLIRKPGYGTYIGNSKEEKLFLKNILLNDKTDIHYKPDERQDYIITELLRAKEPIKMYAFANSLNVTEGTISGDLDKIEILLKKYNIEVVRRQGYGIFIEGSEKNYRKLLVSLIYENKLDKEILSFIGEKVKKIYKPSQVQIDVNNRLLNMVDTNTIETIQMIVRKIEKSKKYKLNDSQYVALIVHLSLAIERIKGGDNIKIDPKYLFNLRPFEEFKIAKFIASEIEESFNVKIPEDEIAYITMHLMGSSKKIDLINFDDTFYVDRYRIIRTSRAMLKKASKIENIDFLKDDMILLDLARHLEIAIKRINMGVDIRNPLIHEIKTKYKKIFKTGTEVSKILEKEFDIKVPEGEIGYIAIHLGGAAERINNYLYKVYVLCPSGIGTSRLLATKIDNEFKNIKVVNIASILNLENDDLLDIDFLISTVPLNINKVPWVVISPLLLDDDIKTIKEFIQKIKIQNRNIKAKKEIKNQKDESKYNLKEYLELKINYAKAGIEILDNFVYKNVEINSFQDILNVIQKADFHIKGGWEILETDINKRESLGKIVLEDLKTRIIHSRSNKVKHLSVMFIDIKNKCVIDNKNLEKVVILLAPIDIREEYVETVGSISAGFIKKDLLKVNGEKNANKFIESILKDFYKNKI